MIPVDIVRNQSAFRIDARALRELARALAAKSGRPLRDITLILVDDAGIAPINAAARLASSSIFSAETSWPNAYHVE